MQKMKIELKEQFLFWGGENKVVFVIPKEVYQSAPASLKLKYFLVEGTALEDRREGMRDSFDSNQELIDFLISNYDSEKRKNNIFFDTKKELDYYKSRLTNSEIEALKKQNNNLKKKNEELDSRLNRWLLLLNVDFSTIEFPSKVSIYGCGAVGRILYQKIREYCCVVEFIDLSPRQEFYDQIPVVRLKESKADKDTTIIVVPTYDYEKIVDKLVKHYIFQPKVIGLEEFLVQGKVIDENF